MRFSIELEGIVKLFRLQKDRSWRDCANKGLSPTDLTCETVEDVLSLSVLKGELQIGETVFEVGREGVESRPLPTLSYTSSVFRREFPPVPSLDQLREVIRGGDGTVNNSLILNVEGKFELLQSPPYEVTSNNPMCAVRYETFNAGTDYVGVKASRDDSHILEVYARMMSCWVDHLKSGSTQWYFEEGSPISTEELPQILDEMKKAWVPQY